MKAKHILTMLVAGVCASISASAQGEFSRSEAKDAALKFFSHTSVVIFVPTNDVMPTKVKLSEQDRSIAGGIVSAAIEEGENRTGCWNPHHAFSVDAVGKKTDLVLCFECKQGFFASGESITWFAIGRGQEKALNDLFHKYGLDGSASLRSQSTSEVRRLPSRPNQSLEPTATAVTPPAAQEIVPAVAVAQH